MSGPAVVRAQGYSAGKRKNRPEASTAPQHAGARWRELKAGEISPAALVAVRVRVYWPEDACWYPGLVTGYNPSTYRHQVEYDDGDVEPALLLSAEKVQVSVTPRTLPQPTAAELDQMAHELINLIDQLEESSTKTAKLSSSRQSTKHTADSEVKRLRALAQQLYALAEEAPRCHPSSTQTAAEASPAADESSSPARKRLKTASSHHPASTRKANSAQHQGASGGVQQAEMSGGGTNTNAGQQMAVSLQLPPYMVHGGCHAAPNGPTQTLPAAVSGARGQPACLASSLQTHTTGYNQSTCMPPSSNLAQALQRLMQQQQLRPVVEQQPSSNQVPSSTALGSVDTERVAAEPPQHDAERQAAASLVADQQQDMATLAQPAQQGSRPRGKRRSVAGDGAADGPLESQSSADTDSHPPSDSQPTSHVNIPSLTQLAPTTAPAGSGLGNGMAHPGVDMPVLAAENRVSPLLASLPAAEAAPPHATAAQQPMPASPVAERSALPPGWTAKPAVHPAMGPPAAPAAAAQQPMPAVHPAKGPAVSPAATAQQPVPAALAATHLILQALQEPPATGHLDQVPAAERNSSNIDKPAALQLPPQRKVAKPRNRQKAASKTPQADAVSHVAGEAAEGSVQQQAAGQDAASGRARQTGADRAREIEALGRQLAEAYEVFQDERTRRQQFRELEVAVHLAPELAVGRQVRVYWADDDAWYLGTVASYNPATGQHKVDYADGMKEEMHLAGERLRLLMYAGERLQGPSMQQAAQLGVLLQAAATQKELEAKQAPTPEEGAALMKSGAKLRKVAQQLTAHAACATQCAAGEPAAISSVRPSSLVARQPPTAGPAITHPSPAVDSSAQATTDHSAILDGAHCTIAGLERVPAQAALTADEHHSAHDKPCATSSDALVGPLAVLKASAGRKMLSLNRPTLQLPEPAAAAIDDSAGAPEPAARARSSAARDVVPRCIAKAAALREQRDCPAPSPSTRPAPVHRTRTVDLHTLTAAASPPATLSRSRSLPPATESTSLGCAPVPDVPLAWPMSPQGRRRAVPGGWPLSPGRRSSSVSDYMRLTLQEGPSLSGSEIPKRRRSMPVFEPVADDTAVMASEPSHGPTPMILHPADPAPLMTANLAEEATLTVAEPPEEAALLAGNRVYEPAADEVTFTVPHPAEEATLMTSSFTEETTPLASKPMDEAAPGCEAAVMATAPGHLQQAPHAVGPERSAGADVVDLPPQACGMEAPGAASDIMEGFCRPAFSGKDLPTAGCSSTAVTSPRAKRAAASACEQMFKRVLTGQPAAKRRVSTEADQPATRCAEQQPLGSMPSATALGTPAGPPGAAPGLQAMDVDAAVLHPNQSTMWQNEVTHQCKTEEDVAMVIAETGRMVDTARGLGPCTATTSAVGAGNTGAQATSCRAPQVDSQAAACTNLAGANAWADEGLLPGEVVWGQQRGWPFWPAIVMSSEEADAELVPRSRGSSPVAPLVCVHFFGTFDYDRLPVSAVRTFMEGVAGGRHAPKRGLKTKKQHATFRKALSQVLGYLKDGDLPDNMVPSNNDELELDAGEDEKLVTKVVTRPVGSGTPQVKLPLTLANLTLKALGEVEFINPRFHDEQYIWPVGFKAQRDVKTPATKDVALPHVFEILRSPDGFRPLFRITSATGAFVEGDTPTRAWSMLFQSDASAQARAVAKSGAKMFGLAHPLVQRLVQGLPNAGRCERYCGWPEGQEPPAPPPLSEAEAMQRLALEIRQQQLPSGILPVVPTRKLVGLCDVCGEDLEWEGNFLLECDRCRMSVHMECYGVRKDEDPAGRSWLCDVCRTGVTAPPPCALCPVQGGAMKPTTDGRWAHLMCAVWVPDTTFVDVEARQPIDGIQNISKARRSLTCSFCKQCYGACIQCAGGRSCFTAFHPLCARDKGLTMVVQELNGQPAQDSDHENREVNVPTAATEATAAAKAPARRKVREGTEAGDGTWLLCFCAKHGPNATQLTPPHRHIFTDRQPPPLPVPLAMPLGDCGGSLQASGQQTASRPKAQRGKRPRLQAPAKRMAEPPPPPPAAAADSCARSRQYDAASRRGHRAPDALAAALEKRRFVKALPYLVTTRLTSRWPTAESRMYSCNGHEDARLPPSPRGCDTDGAEVLTLSERYTRMNATAGRRLTVGKSAIHGWGAFTKQPHRAGDMVIEYIGELVRPSVADVRERRCYDTLVGAGTYVFALDEERHVDATRAGNMAHLLNHSCDPNCQSRTIRVWNAALQRADDKVVIFAKHDLPAGVEVTYNYRFCGAERLPCNCGAATCCGIVNCHPDEGPQDVISVPRHLLEFVGSTPAHAAAGPQAEPGAQGQA